MKLCLLTYNLGKDFELDELIRICEAYDYDGIEFRSGVGPHGVELDATKAERKKIRKKMEASTVDIAGIGTSCRFESLRAFASLATASPRARIRTW